MMNILNHQIVELGGMKVSVIGGAKSGIAAAMLLKEVGAYPFVSDMNKSAELCLLNDMNIPNEIGDHSERVYDCNLMVVSPGIHQDSEVIAKAKKKSIPVISEIELAYWFSSIPIVAITGSNGKTTTTTILAEMCRKSGFKTFESGNIGTPFSTTVLDNLNNNFKNAIHILEVSSFQMEQIQHFKPQVAIILNLSEDHLDRYGTMESYINAKLNIVNNMSSDNHLVYNLDDKLLCKAIKTEATLVPFSLKVQNDLYFNLNETKIYNKIGEPFFFLDEMKIKGAHNISNFLAAATAAKIINVDDYAIKEVMKTFTGVPHRLEKVRTEGGVTFYNDSKATNLESVKVALESFEAPIILIIGGRNKGGSFKGLKPLFTNRVKLVIAIGEAADEIEKDFYKSPPVQKVVSMASAVSLAYKNSIEGDIVLLSPGCTSFDMFENFEDRGNIFKKEVMRL
ncbi:MAG: UDP-N-acetylmuramoyl-L-alanine--D-glutamate ligase [Candidatus Neomarinimicrobiota bacterium]